MTSLAPPPVVVVGAGAAGLMAALFAARAGDLLGLREVVAVGGQQGLLGEDEVGVGRERRPGLLQGVAVDREPGGSGLQLVAPEVARAELEVDDGGRVAHYEVQAAADLRSEPRAVVPRLGGEQSPPAGGQDLGEPRGAAPGPALRFVGRRRELERPVERAAGLGRDFVKGGEFAEGVGLLEPGEQQGGDVLAASCVADGAGAVGAADVAADGCGDGC